MIQAWILPARARDYAALVRQQRSVCGDCHAQPSKDNTCYVNLRAVLQVVRSLRAGRYARFDRSRHLPLFAGRLLRLGAWGDPCAVPLDVWAPLILRSDGHTVYTHQWRTADPAWRNLIMASVDSAREREEAQAAGWRTFRARSWGTPLLSGEVECPASDLAGKRRTCAECLACDGQTASGRGASVSIEVHGAGGAAMPTGRALARRFAAREEGQGRCQPLQMVS